MNLPDDISCASETDGRIESFASGGVGNNSFRLYMGDPGTDPFNPNAGATLVRGPQADGTFEGLPEGTLYYVTVTSGLTCGDVEGPYEILRPAPIVFVETLAPVSCNGETDGSITIEVTSGGEGLLQFAISPNFNEFFSDPTTPGQYIFTDLAAGDYDVLIQDSQGCSELTTLTITEPNELTASSIETDEICVGFEDGTAQLTITGGTPFVDPVTSVSYYETSLNSSDAADFVRNDNLFYDNLPVNTHVVFIRDANGCTTNVIIPIELGVDLAATAIPQYGCEGIFPNSTVIVEMQDNSVLPRVLFSLDVDDINVATTERTWGDLPAGDHTVYIYHENGCTTFIEFTIDAFDPLTLSAEKQARTKLRRRLPVALEAMNFSSKGLPREVTIFSISQKMLR